MQKQFEKLRAKILAEAENTNFYGKRILDSKLEACEKVLKALDIKAEARTLVDWLTENKPEATAKKATAAEKPAATTMIGNHAPRVDDLDIVKAGELVILTAAQNNTQVDDAAITALEALAEELGAELIVLPIHYNKNAFSAAVEDDSEYFDPRITKYLREESFWLVDHGVVKVASDARVLPTAKYPVNAAATLNNGELATIVPSPKQQLKTLPRLQGSEIKEAWSTGCCTVYNYIDSRAGAEAEVDHTYGGLLIVDRGDSINITNLEVGKDGRIALSVKDEPEPPVAILGDLHCEVYDPEIWETTLKWLDDLESIHSIVVHDILHFSTRSHHNRNSGKHIYANKHNTVEKDLEQVIKQLNQLAALAPVYVVESNHNSAIDNWLDDSCYKPQTDAHNAKLYYLLNWLICDTIDNNTSADQAILAIDLALQNADLTGLTKLSDNITFGRMDKPHVVYGYDLSCHGHKGQNGSAGNTTLFSKWRLKMVTGHTHSPAIIGNVLTVGVTARLDQGYNRGGASSWANSHGMIFSNSTKRIIPMNKRKY